MTTFQHNLEKYAALIAKTGINVQDGDTVVIQIAVSQAEFARDITAACYDLGAAEVIIKWQDDAIDRINMQHKALFPEIKFCHLHLKVYLCTIMHFNTHIQNPIFIIFILFSEYGRQ